MSWLETLRTGLDAVLSHRLRSGLTMLGILIGIAAVILTVGLGEGAQAKVSGEINALGSNLLVVSPGSATSSTGIRGGFGSASTLTQADAAALASKIVAPDIAAVAPATQRSETLTSTGTNWTTTVVGTAPDWLSVRARTVTQGRFLTAADEKADAAVTVLGATTAQELFGSRDPVGQTATVNGLPLTVIGVLNTVGASASSTTTNLDDQAVVPITTATNTAGKPINVGAVAESIAITPDGKTAYVPNSRSGTVTAISTVTNTAEAPIKVGTGPVAVAFTPDGKTAYVVSLGADTVTPISTATNTPGKPIRAGIRPYAIVVAHR